MVDDDPAAGPARPRPKVAGLLLAAGGGRRYGQPKALVEYSGMLLVERGAAMLRAAGCAPVIVVLGAAADRVRAVADVGDAMIAVNPDWAGGMGSSLRVGLAAAGGTSADAVVVLLVDMPDVTPAAVRRVAARAAPDVLATATYDGLRGHPVVLGRDHGAGAAALALGDVGARPYLAAHAADVVGVPCDDVARPTDLDIPPGGDDKMA